MIHVTLSGLLTRNDQAFSAYNDDLLTLEKTFGDGGGKSTHEVTVTVDYLDSVAFICHR